MRKQIIAPSGRALWRYAAPVGGNATLVNVQACVRTNVLQEATLAIYEDDRLAWCAPICTCCMSAVERLCSVHIFTCSQCMRTSAMMSLCEHCVCSMRTCNLKRYFTRDLLCVRRRCFSETLPQDNLA